MQLVSTACSLLSYRLCVHSQNRTEDAVDMLTYFRNCTYFLLALPTELNVLIEERPLFFKASTESYSVLLCGFNADSNCNPLREIWSIPEAYIFGDVLGR